MTELISKTLAQPMCVAQQGAGEAEEAVLPQKRISVSHLEWCYFSQYQKLKELGLNSPDNASKAAQKTAQEAFARAYARFQEDGTYVRVPDTELIQAGLNAAYAECQERLVDLDCQVAVNENDELTMTECLKKRSNLRKRGK